MLVTLKDGHDVFSKEHCVAGCRNQYGSHPSEYQTFVLIY